MRAIVWSTFLASVLFFQQGHQPGDTLSAICSGQWANVVTTGTAISADCITTTPELTDETRIVVGHPEVALYDQVPLESIQPLRVITVNRSVGWNIADGVQRCLSVDVGDAPNGCTRWAWNNGQYPSSPMAWTARPLPAWRFFSWPGSGFPNTPDLPCSDPSTYVRCFESYVDAHASQWDVVSMQPSYLDAGTYMLPLADYLAASQRLKARHPSLTIVLHTASLAKVIGTAQNDAFNRGVRDHVAAHGGVLLDIAQIESTDPHGMLWTHNGYPAIAPHYNSEPSGGHLGYPSTGKIRLAMAWHVVLARIAGWEPNPDE